MKSIRSHPLLALSIFLITGALISGTLLAFKQAHAAPPASLALVEATTTPPAAQTAAPSANMTGILLLGILLVAIILIGLLWGKRVAGR